ncbi:anthranilate synthase component I [Synechocystis sp. PCC 7509]|uniref:anthranilate synthase component I n=1 Tax=Synechocystis sp. PCC 7509 TaxID=927677 RepID=UPI0002ABCA3D|nr:anthranilate synthase component I [Synechocystis sp. PCC 7509]
MEQSWYWKSLPLENRTGAEIFAALFGDAEISTLLESPLPTTSDRTPLARYSICAGSPRLIDGCLQMWTPPIGKIFPFLEQLLNQTSLETNLNYCPKHLPFTGGWLGWLGYDAAWEIEKLPWLRADSLPFPVAYWYQPASFAVLDRLEQIVWLAAAEVSQLDTLVNQLKSSPTPPKLLAARNFPVSSFLTSQTDYEAAVRRAKKYIQAGDIFQANLSVRFGTQTTTDSWEIYRTLQQINPSPFASYWRSPWGQVISCSPERLVQLDNGIAQTRPIAGTRSRGATTEQDNKLAQEMMASAKEKSEHIMLVDLERNDLGRVCQWGSVEVDELLTIERYSHVMHLVSNVKGVLSPQTSPIELIRAMFPGGTISGCPKVRCMEIIEELEPVRRSLFYGSCGYLDWRGNLDLNILIRTLLAIPSNNATSMVWGQVGAGIVADSDPETEWYESLQKAQAQLAALGV